MIISSVLLRNTTPTRGLASTFITKWLGSVARALGVRTKTYGTALTEKTLFVSNHISWLDIFVIGGLVPVHFLSKRSEEHTSVTNLVCRLLLEKNNDFMIAIHS